jgi:hypothetical protein
LSNAKHEALKRKGRRNARTRPKIEKIDEATGHEEQEVEEIDEAEQDVEEVDEAEQKAEDETFSEWLQIEIKKWLNADGGVKDGEPDEEEKFIEPDAEKFPECGWQPGFVDKVRLALDVEDLIKDLPMKDAVDILEQVREQVRRWQ